MRTGSTIADPPVPVTLKDQELIDRGQHLVEMIIQRAEMKASKDRENKKRQGEIEEIDEEIARLARVIHERHEDRAQGDLFVDQALAKDDAARKLAEIAERAAKHPFVASETAIDTCAKDGCGAQATADVHIPPAPAEAHTFVPDGKGEGNCWACGSGADDPVHAEPKAAPARDPNAPHAAEFGEQPEGEPQACLFCSRSVDDPIHAVAVAGMESANTPSNETGEIAATFVCDDCIASGADAAAATHPKADGMWLDAEARKVCPNCRQAAIEGGRWAHTFKAGHLRAKKCSDCGFRLDHATHVPPDEEPANQGEPLAAPADPAYDFDEGEKPPTVIASARAIEETDPADDGPVGGEAGA